MFERKLEKPVARDLLHESIVNVSFSISVIFT